MYKTVVTVEELEVAISKEASLIYISHEDCNVCKVLKPKVEELFEEKFGKVKLYYVNTHKTPDVAAQLSVFAVPAVVIIFDGREFFRESRSISLPELESKVTRVYKMMFE